MLYKLMQMASRLPWWMLYGAMRPISVLIHRVARYRLGVVRANLASSFPEMSRRELRRVERLYYRFLGEYLVETLKLASMDAAEMSRRMTFTGIDALNADIAAGRDVSLFLGHYCNWEWVSSMPLHLDSRGVGTQIYKPLRSKGVDSAFLRLRSRFGAVSIPKHDTLRALVRLKRQGRTTVTGYIADQIPGYGPVHLWLPFLNHDTAVFVGAERVGRMLKSSLYYCRMRRVRLGYYNCEFIPVSADVSAEEQDAPTRRCFELLEEDIRRAPQYWLWSHRRWKRTRSAE